MFEAYDKRHPKTIVELKETQHTIWDRPPQGLINKAVKELTEVTEGFCSSLGRTGHLEHT